MKVVKNPEPERPECYEQIRSHREGDRIFLPAGYCLSMCTLSCRWYGECKGLPNEVGLRYIAACELSR